MTKDEALKDLLKIVEHAIEIGDWKVDGRCDPDLAINRAKEALEQPPPKVEPFDVWAGTKPQEDVPIVFPRWDNGEPFEVRYPKQPAQEPVAWMSEGGIFTRTKEHAEIWSNNGGKVTPVYTHPEPSWQGLSDDEIYKCQHPEYPDTMYFARAIEQALKEKNT